MKIVYDNIVFSLQKSGGISVVWYELLKRMLHDKSNELLFIEYKSAENNIFRLKLKLPFKKSKEFKDYLLFLIRYINPRMSCLKDPFIFHSSYYRISSNKNAINITTVHDFIYEKFRKGIKKEIHCIQKKNALRKSQLILCVSENTKKDLLLYYPEIDSKKIFVVHNGVSEDYKVITSHVIPGIKYANQQYLIYVGVRDEYKRFDIAVEITKKLNLNLVIVGGGKLTANEISFIESRLNKNQYQIFANLSNSDLNILYSNALCLIYPSSYEGFGIPVIEAQKSGCPVVAYDNGAVKEIIGNTPLLFKEFDLSHIYKIIVENLFDVEKRSKIIDEGLKNSENYSWEITYQKTREIYNLLFKEF